jgi:hypothetical protein
MGKVETITFERDIIENAVDKLTATLKEIAIDIDNKHPEYKLNQYIKIILSNFAGFTIIKITNYKIISNFKDNAEEYMNLQQEYFDYAVPEAVKQVIEGKKNDK